MTSMRTMDCTDIKALLSGLIDDEVDAVTRHAAERHLAECVACRNLVSEAERMDAAIALEAKLATQGGALPEGFEAKVLANTVLAGRGRAPGRLWINWTGWLAAAASLMLAVTLLVIQFTGSRGSTSGGAVASNENSGPKGTGSTATSMTKRETGARLASFQPTFGFPPDQYEAVVFSPGRVTTDASAMGAGGGAMSNDAQSMLAEHDSQILYATMLAVSMVTETDEARWSEDTTMVQRIVEYDELLPRLDAAVKQVSPANKPALFAARATLARIAEGLDSLSDVREMQDILRGLDVMQNLRRMNERGYAGASL